MLWQWPWIDRLLPRCQQRIRNGFSDKGIKINTSFIGAAIATNMAGEIWAHLTAGDLDYAANLTVDEQVIDYCNWIITQ